MYTAQLLFNLASGSPYFGGGFFLYLVKSSNQRIIFFQTRQLDMPLSYRPEKDPFAIFLASIFILFIFLGIFSPYLPSRIIPTTGYVIVALPFLGFATYYFWDIIMKYKVYIGVAFIALIIYNYDFSDKPCTIRDGQGFHMDNTIAIKFNSDGRFNSSDNLMNLPKSFWGTWQQQGNKIITTTNGSTTGMGIGQQNTYTYDCDKLTIGSFTLIKD